MPASPRPAAALWDFDGTLVDSEEIWYAAECDVMGWLGGAWTREQWQVTIGRGLHEVSKTMLTASGRIDVSVDEVADLIAATNLQMSLAEPPDWRPGARELLVAAREAGVPCALVSSTPTTILNAFIDRQVPGMFEAVVGGEQVQHSKPDPEAYLLACSLLGVEAADCVVFEDTHVGMAAGHASGALVFGVPFIVPLTPAPRQVVLESLVGQTWDGIVSRWLREGGRPDA